MEIPMSCHMFHGSININLTLDSYARNDEAHIPKEIRLKHFAWISVKIQSKKVIHNEKLKMVSVPKTKVAVR